MGDWLKMDTDEVHRLPSLCSELPVVAYPRQHPQLADFAIEMFSDEITEILQCEHLPDLHEEGA